MITWVLLASLCSLTVAQQCTFVNGDIIARWQVINGGLTVEMTNNNIGNNQWTGVGFGTDMSNLEVVLVQIRNNRPSLVTGFTQGYGSPTIDSTPNVVVQSLNYNSNTLVVRFTRPVGPTGSRGVSLQDCMTWNFFSSNPLQGGQITNLGPSQPLNNVCPTQCTLLFDSRDPIANAVPLASVFNNRQSSRFDNLQPNSAVGFQ